MDQITLGTPHWIRRALSRFLLPLNTIMVSRWGEAHGNKPIILVLLVLPCYVFAAWLSFSDLIVDHEEFPFTMRGIQYLHSTCHTGAGMRRLLLNCPNHYYRALIRFLLRMEKIPYKISLLFGYLCAIPFAIAQMDVPGFYLDTRMSRFDRRQWAVLQAVFLLMFILAHGYEMVRQIRELRQAVQRHEKIMRQAALLQEQINLIDLQYEGTEEQDQLGESSRSQLG
jgi:hypothetical protein